MNDSQILGIETWKDTAKIDASNRFE